MAQGEGDEDSVLATVVDDVADQPPPVLFSKQSSDPGQPAEPGQSQQVREPEEAEGRDRAEEIEPSAAADEITALRGRPFHPQAEVGEEHETDHIVVDVEQRERGLAQR